jgi:hypothetical protein
MLRYLRIAVSAVSLVAYLLVIALWVRSYSQTDTLVLAAISYSLI